ncbi:MAG: PRC-barrel domain-containing protein [Gemmatimonadaceae bacterium]|nr:PRC-barrel domain-containing protein [Gemmatimonadaceae bacterium]
MADRLEQDRTNRADQERPTGAAAAPTLARLHDLDDYEVADGEPDIRGWKVKTADGKEVGEVDGLIVDPDALEVRYVEVKVNDELHEGREKEFVLVPIGVARLDEDSDTMFVHSLPDNGLLHAPRFAREPITADHDRTLITYYGKPAERTADHQTRFFGTRRRGREQSGYFTRSGQQNAGGNDEVVILRAVVIETGETPATDRTTTGGDRGPNANRPDARG